MGGMFHCGQCGRTHHSDDGYNVATLEDGNLLEFCDDGYQGVIADHLNGERPLAVLDGKSLADNFVCPDCWDITPNADGQPGGQCPRCSEG